jgi:DNA-binding transcriptional LysR family regulator
LNATQPTVSLQLRALRKSLGIPLFERPGGRFRLTPAGEKLRRYAEEALGGLRLLQQELDVLKGSFAGPLQVGATFTVGRYVLPSPLFRFREQFADVNLQFHVDIYPEQLFNRLLASTLDVACYIRVDTPPGLTVEPIGDEELIVAAAPQHPLAGRRRVSPDELSRHPFVASAVAAFREMADKRLREAGVTPLVVGHGQHQDAVKKLVERNGGYSLLVRSAAAEELADGRLVMLQLVGAPFPTDVVVAYRAGPAVSPLVRRFIEFVRAELNRKRSASAGLQPWPSQGGGPATRVRRPKRRRSG